MSNQDSSNLLCLGLFIGFIVVAYLLSKKDKVSSTTERYTGKLVHDGRSAYSVMYRSGHQGIDHYLRMYLKQDRLDGTLSILEDGIQFISIVPRTEQKFSLQWSRIKEAFAKTEGLNQQEWLYVKTLDFLTISFTTAEAEVIAARINSRKDAYSAQVEKEGQLIQTQIKARDLDVIPPKRFEYLVGEVFKAMGYTVSVVGASGDEGVDIVATRYNEKIIVQCKRQVAKVGAPIVRDFYGAIVHNNANAGYIVTTADFTDPATKWAADKPIKLVNRIQLAAWLDQFKL